MKPNIPQDDMLRKLLKHLLLVIALVVTSPLWAATGCYQRLLGSEALFVSCAQFMSLLPGVTGVYFRRAFYFMTLHSCRSDIFVEFGTTFSHRYVAVGKGVYIGGRCTIGTCEIGDFSLIGSNVDVISGRRQHNFSDSTRNYCEQTGVFTQIHIGRNTWLGNSSVIMADIGQNTIVGAGSVVVNPVPPNSVVAGNPAKVKRTIARGCPAKPERS